MADLHQRLVAAKPDEKARPGIAHGDYRFDNTVLGPDFRIAAVLDWELSTIGNPIADLMQPDLRVLVDLGYANYGPGGNYANVPTPAGLFSVPNPFVVIPDLATGAVQGVRGAMVDVGWLPQSDTPTTYPYVPSLDPSLNFSFGQSSATLLSTVSGELGNGLELIPPPTLT